MTRYDGDMTMTHHVKAYMGLVFTVVPIYLGEISSPCQRGSITGLFSAAWFLGYLLEYCVGPYLSYIAYTVLTASVSIIFTITFISQPESPYYLLTVGRADEALLTLRRLRKGCSEESITREYDNMKESVKEDSSTATSWNDLIATPADRRALVIIFLIGGTRILSGAMAVMSYSTELFKEAGIKALSPDVLTICLGFAFLFGGLVNAFVVDQVGRRPLIFISCAGSFVSLLTVSVYFYLRKSPSLDVTPYSWVVPLGVIMYCVFSVVGIYPVSMTYTSELFTTRTRGRAASLSSINLAIFSFICIELYQYVGDNFGLDKVFFVFASICLSGAIALYFLAPETKGKTFTEIRADILHVKERKQSIIVREDLYI
uniref:Major facilitator superfamily (MFS) profile domain-containing protein n=1 Tax=Clastoptera arizonana TaxID=38151 RepID=A0A1B6C5D7_9HEMI